MRTPVRDPKETIAALQAFARSKGGWAQILDAGHVVGTDHIRSAFRHAERALARGTQITNSLELELLLYASGERQISRAIQRVGAREGKPFVLIVGGGLSARDVLRRFKWTPDPSAVAVSLRKLRAHGFTKTEIEVAGPRHSDLILERVARVDLLT